MNINLANKNLVLSIFFALSANQNIWATEVEEVMPPPAPALRPYLPEPTEMPPLAPSWRQYLPETSGIISGITTIRVGILLNVATAQISSSGGAIVKDESNGKIIGRLPANNSWRIAAVGNNNPIQISFLESTESVSPYKEIGFLTTAESTITKLISKFTLPADQKTYVIEPENSELININNKPYRGHVLIYPNVNKNNFSVINTVNLEDYLKSVVPSEMPSSWSKEAIKAQAIAARSYAMANLGKHNSEGYDVKATTEDQVYKGVASETEFSNNCIAETERLIMKYNGKVISAYFHSTSGGATELAENVWNSSVPFLKSVIDIETASPYNNWTRSFTPAQLEDSLKKANKDIGYIFNLLPISLTPSGRVSYVLASGNQKALLLTGEELRHILNLPSTLFKLNRDQDSYSFAGRGFGHGLGLSQWGAKALAEQGYNAEQILSYYYKDITIERY